MTEPTVEQTSFENRYDAHEYDPTYYDPGEIDRDIGRLRPQETDERTSWGYLGVLCVVFLGLIGSAQACEALEDDPAGTDVVIDETGVSVSTLVRLTAEVEGDIITIRGTVPDEDTRARLVSTVETVYNPANLIDEVTIDENVTIEGGSVAVNGVTTEDDDRPERVRDAIIDAFDLEDGGVAVQRSEEGALLPVSVDGFIEGGVVRLSGAVPDQAALDAVTEAASAAWGADSVDLSGLTIGERTWEGGQIRITGTAAPGDTGHEAFAADISGRIGDQVTVDVSGVGADVSSEGLSTVEAEIQEAVTANPILFEPQSSDLDPSSNAVLTVIADRLAELPDVQIEIVGHTDDQGPEDENLALSQDRADAVLAELVELGVDEERMTARGEGESSPLVDEDTDEARAQNRRIEFRLTSG